MNQEFSDALNDCLDRLVQGDDVGECLRRYPKQADELEPLLHVALATIRAAESVKPDRQAKARNFARFSQAVEAGPRRSEGVRSSRAWWDWRAWVRGLRTPAARPVAVGMGILLVFALGAGGATAASEGSVPGEPLYWVKTTRESVERRLPRSDDGRAAYEAGLAHTRGHELGKLIERGHFTRADVTMRRMNDHLVRSARYAGVTVCVNPIEMPFRPPAQIGRDKADLLRHRLENDREAFRAKVKVILSDLDPEDRRRAERVFRRTELGYWLLIDAMQPASPNSGAYLIVQIPRHGHDKQRHTR